MILETGGKSRKTGSEFGCFMVRADCKMRLVDFQGLIHVRASARNNYTSCLSFGPSTALHPQAHILICTSGCALYTNQNPAQSCAIIFCRGPKITSPILVLNCSKTIYATENSLYFSEHECSINVQKRGKNTICDGWTTLLYNPTSSQMRP